MKRKIKLLEGKNLMESYTTSMKYKSDDTGKRYDVYSIGGNYSSYIAQFLVGAVEAAKNGIDPSDYVRKTPALKGIFSHVEGPNNRYENAYYFKAIGDNSGDLTAVVSW